MDARHVRTHHRGAVRVPDAVPPTGFPGVQEQALRFAFTGRRDSAASRYWATSSGPDSHRDAPLEYLSRYLTESEPTLADVAQVAALLAERSLMMRGL